MFAIETRHHNEQEGAAPAEPPIYSSSENPLAHEIKEGANERQRCLGESRKLRRATPSLPAFLQFQVFTKLLNA